MRMVMWHMCWVDRVGEPVHPGHCVGRGMPSGIDAKVVYLFGTVVFFAHVDDRVPEFVSAEPGVS